MAQPGEQGLQIDPHGGWYQTPRSSRATKPHPQDVYWNARREYAFMLKCEGMTYREIGVRLEIHRSRAQQLVMQQGRWLAKAMRRTKVTVQPFDGCAIEPHPHKGGSHGETRMSNVQDMTNALSIISGQIDKIAQEQQQLLGELQRLTGSTPGKTANQLDPEQQQALDNAVSYAQGIIARLKAIDDAVPDAVTPTPAPDTPSTPDTPPAADPSGTAPPASNQAG